jgi:hypothetical protein
MKPQQFLLYICLLTVIYFIAATGCTMDSSTPNPTSALVHITNTPSVAMTIPTYTAEPELITTLTATQLSTEPPTPKPITPTLPPTLSPTSTPIAPTFTPLPTLAPAEAGALTLELLENNGGCQLPCWWGATPEETSWETIASFLNSFALKVTHLGDETSTNPAYELRFTVPESINLSGRIRVLYSVRKGVIEDIGIELGNSPHYGLSQVLTTYGQPSEVWLSTYSRSRDNNLPFRVILVYLDGGFVIKYFDEAEEIGQMISGCPQQMERQFIDLWLWNPERILTFRQILGEASLFGRQQTYLPLEEAAEMEIQTFYETFKDSNNDTCLETPAILWPDP